MNVFCPHFVSFQCHYLPPGGAERYPCPLMAVCGSPYWASPGGSIPHGVAHGVARAGRHCFPLDTPVT